MGSEYLCQWHFAILWIIFYANKNNTRGPLSEMQWVCTMHIAQSKEALYTIRFKECLKTFLFGLRCTYIHIYIYIYIYRYLFRPSYSNQMALSSNTLTMQSNGLPERLQVCFYRWTCLRGRGSAWRYHCKSWWSPGATWRWGFTTEEADKILTPNSPPPFLHPCQDIFVSSLMTDLNTQLITPLMGIDTLWERKKNKIKK